MATIKCTACEGSGYQAIPCSDGCCCACCAEIDCRECNGTGKVEAVRCPLCLDLTAEEASFCDCGGAQWITPAEARSYASFYELPDAAE